MAGLDLDTEGIFDAVACVIRPGDEVIVFEPCYDSYVPSIELNGGTAVVISLRYPDYAVVGRVTKGMDVVQQIGKLGDASTEQPTQPIVIQKATVSG